MKSYIIVKTYRLYMYRINPKRYQWIIDVLFGIGFILPLILIILNFVGEQFIYLTIGLGIGYIFHITQKMLVFSDMLEEALEHKAEDKIESEAEEKVQTKVENKVPDEVETEISQKKDSAIEDKVEEVVDDKIENN